MQNENQPKKYYLVMDGRANFDIDEASVMDTIGEVSKTQAKKAFRREWLGLDAVLVSFDMEGENTLSNGQVIPVYQGGTK